MDREKYVAYALKRNTLAWKRIEDIPKEHKATSINLEDENSRYIVTQDIFKADEEVTHTSDIAFISRFVFI